MRTATPALTRVNGQTSQRVFSALGSTAFSQFIINCHEFLLPDRFSLHIFWQGVTIICLEEWNDGRMENATRGRINGPVTFSHSVDRERGRCHSSKHERPVVHVCIPTGRSSGPVSVRVQLHQQCGACSTSEMSLGKASWASAGMYIFLVRMWRQMWSGFMECDA
jgi:hypothetical protein